MDCVFAGRHAGEDSGAGIIGQRRVSRARAGGDDRRSRFSWNIRQTRADADLPGFGSIGHGTEIFHIFGGVSQWTRSGADAGLEVSVRVLVRINDVVRTNLESITAVAATETGYDLDRFLAAIHSTQHLAELQSDMTPGPQRGRCHSASLGLGGEVARTTLSHRRRSIFNWKRVSRGCNNVEHPTGEDRRRASGRRAWCSWASARAREEPADRSQQQHNGEKNPHVSILPK